LIVGVPLQVPPPIYCTRRTKEVQPRDYKKVARPRGRKDKKIAAEGSVLQSPNFVRTFLAPTVGLKGNPTKYRHGNNEEHDRQRQEDARRERKFSAMID